MEFINLTERAGVPRTTNSVVANDPGAVCVAGAGESAGVDATLRRLPLCVHASACLLPATVVEEVWQYSKLAKYPLKNQHFAS